MYKTYKYMKHLLYIKNWKKKCTIRNNAEIEQSVALLYTSEKEYDDDEEEEKKTVHPKDSKGITKFQ